MRFAQVATGLVLYFVLSAEAFGQDVAKKQVVPSFSADIQPIFARYCTACHGGVKQAADVSFVDGNALLPPNGWLVEPGQPDDSLLIERITSSDPDLRMPPPEEHPEPLTEDEIDLVRRWIAGGANWQDHWSRQQLKVQSPPDLGSPDPGSPDHREAAQWAKQPLDHFVWDKLERLGRRPSAPAEPVQWLRRVSFDLIGLPPTLEELASFQTRLAGTEDPEAEYGREVDRLLESPHYGERWATMWMDLARYADSKGYEKDPHRDIWPFRDWLINAFNDDMPYDQFTIKQLAGDLLPDATYADFIATAFHRNTQTNTEGGTDDEEFRMAAVIDRLNTTWTVWQGTTFGCVQCHAHPYEPFENRDYYAGLALFNTTEDVDLDNEFPTIPYLADPDQQRQWLTSWRKRQQLQSKLDAAGRQAAKQATWHPLSVEQLQSTSGQLDQVGDEIQVVSGTVAVGSKYTLTAEVGELTALRVEIWPQSDDPKDWPEQGAVLSQLQAFVVDADGGEREIEFSTAIPDYRTGSYRAEESLQPGKEGFGGYPKLHAPRWAVFVAKEPQRLADGQRLRLQLSHQASVTGGLSNHIRRLRIQTTDSAELLEWSSSAASLAAREQLSQLQREQSRSSGVSVPIIRSQTAAAQRDTRQFIRGNWLERGEVVQPGIPKLFAAQRASPADVTDRLEFARWLVSKDNPLAARVWVNRIWAELFGLGLVETLEDLGVSGSRPSHPALLDHLAMTMRDQHQWSLKAWLRTVVLSATYRQDARATEELKRLDPRNRWLARGPRTRLTAEMVRDQALLASGLLSPKLGGASVMPPQPEGVWQQAYSSAKWQAAEGADRYRRGIYTYWRRTSPYPGFLMFDTPSRDVCSPRRIATNTPLQALVTLNSEVYTELAQALARRCWKEVQHGDGREADNQYVEAPNFEEQCIRTMYLRVTSREISDAELSALVALISGLMETRAEENQVERAPTPSRHSLHSTRLAPMEIVALAILNSDWAFNK